MIGLRRHLTYANTVATLALFAALGGTSYAALSIPANSVGTKQLKKGAVTAEKVKPHSLVVSDFKPGQLRGAPGPPGLQGLKGDPGSPGQTGPQGSAGPNNLSTGAASVDSQTLGSGCSSYELTKTFTVPARSVLFASGQTQFEMISPTGSHSTAGQMRLDDPSGQVATTTFSAGGDVNTPLTNSGILTSASAPFVLQPGITYTLHFFMEVNGNCGGQDYFYQPSLSYIAMPAS